MSFYRPNTTRATDVRTQEHGPPCCQIMEVKPCGRKVKPCGRNITPCGRKVKIPDRSSSLAWLPILHLLTSHPNSGGKYLLEASSRPIKGYLRSLIWDTTKILKKTLLEKPLFSLFFLCKPLSRTLNSFSKISHENPKNISLKPTFQNYPTPCLNSSFSKH